MIFVVSIVVPEETIKVNVYDLQSGSTIPDVKMILNDIDTGKTMEKNLVSGGTFPVTDNHSYQYWVSKEGYANRTGSFRLNSPPPYSLNVSLVRPIPLKLVEIRPTDRYIVKISGQNSTRTLIVSPA